MNNGTCCHSSCLGGCYGISDEECIACKKVLYQNKCQDQCPEKTFIFINRICLTEKQCRELRMNALDNDTYVPFHNKCIKSCPAKFKKTKVNSTSFS